MLLLADFLKTLPVWMYGIAGGVLFMLLVVLVVVVPRVRFRKRLVQVSDDPEQSAALIRDHYDDATLLQRSALVTRIATKLENDQLPALTGVDELWVQRLVQTRHARTLRRVLQYAPDKGLFACFVVGLEKPRLAPMFHEWLAEADDPLVLRRVALSGAGEDFSGKAALEVLHDRIESIRELAGDPEWESRYFAAKIILNDDSDRSTRVAWDAFNDPCSLVRKTVAAEFKSDDGDRMFDALLGLLLEDPVFEVRQAARERIADDYAAKYEVRVKDLDSWQAQHVLELLRPGDKRDEDMALTILSSSNLELRLTAALYLDQAGVLDTLFESNDFGDREALERNYTLLQNACEVNVTTFLDKVRKADNPASILIASRLLVDYGDRETITILADKVFSYSKEKKLSQDYFDTYQTLLECISRRGTDVALRLLERELASSKRSPEFLTLILPAIPERGEHIFLNPLIVFLLDPEFPAKDSLRRSLLKMPRHVLVPTLVAILKAGATGYPHAVRVQSIRLLGEMRVPYCLQILLENLPILGPEEGKAFSRLLSEYADEEFGEKVRQLLESTDAGVRAAIISSLPATGKRDFLRFVRSALKDPDPGVRIAGIWSLLDFDDARTVNQSFALLRDPVERVRIEVAKAIGSCASPAQVRNLKSIVDDENETDAVKVAAIRGLGCALETSSVDALCLVYEDAETLREEAVRGLGRKTEPRQLERLAEIFGSAVPVLKDGITLAAVRMKEKGEEAMVALLEQDVRSLKPHLAAILESTGYVEATIRVLSHRSPLARQEAARILTLVETPASYRGIVLAARDPDKEVRVQIIKALEKLETEGGEAILAELENDPDRKVRKYTHWALERLKAKALV
jgi:HEAT repeat protein